jgi:hypothetical protein
MRIQGAVAAVVLAGLIALPLAGCASQSSQRVKISAQKMCEAAGGTYKDKMCHPGKEPRHAGDMCRAHGGFYNAALDWCEMDFSGAP